MVIISITKLSSQQTVAAQHLISKVHEHDQTFRDPYLSNRFNYFADMPAFFLALHGQELIGLLTLYADEDPSGSVDVTLNVVPAWRRQGVAKQLWQAARLVLRQYGYYEADFLAEKTFLKTAPDFLANTGLVADPVSEFQMTLKVNGHQEKDPDLNVTAMQAADIPALLPAYVDAFPDSNKEEAKHYLTENLQADGSFGYVCRYQGQMIGYCAVDFGEYDYLFGLFIAKNYRGRGLGSRFIVQLTQQLAAVRHHSFKLAVESDNPAAHHVYRKAAFKDEGEIFYLQAEQGPWYLEK
ncbi:hypothetical protein NT95_05170 [Oenococcus kitaharae]|nr:hypothetical protein NT95_05170 [Oenococcus kitaharae]OEY85483.1 hypothetical protein NT96_01615 [Oenococcus kitaharae]OEY86337.1 hypothetical protein NV75_01565 [Oenococcus kitaharae]